MDSYQTRGFLQTTEPLTIPESPYTYVRTRVMKSELLSKSDYEKLLKMSLSEIVQFLEESSYKKEIDELAISEDGIQLVEHAVNRNFRRAIEKLRRISSPELRFVISVYLWRNDVQNIKTLLRAKRSGEKAERVANLIIPGTMPKAELLRIYDLASIEDMLPQLATPVTKNALAVYRKDGLVALESEMTKQYYAALFAVGNRLAGQGEAFTQFVELELASINITTILKLKSEGMDRATIETYLIRGVQGSTERAKTYATRGLLQRLLAADTVESCFAILKDSRFAKVAQRGEAAYAEKGSLLVTERELQRRLLKQTTLLTHTNPLSIDVILGYLFAKVNEIRNIFLLIKGKQLGVAEQFLAEEVLVA